MEINRLFIFIAVAVVFGSLSTAQSTDGGVRRRNKDGSCNDQKDCYQYERCENNECIGACTDSGCGINAWCDVKDHVGVCRCWDGYLGDPHVECMQPNCTANEDCNDFEKCEDNKCINACATKSCDGNTRCITKLHEASCACEFGLVGDPATGCGKRSCSAHNDCYFSEKCENNECVEACDGTSCSSNAFCQVENHSAVCSCTEKYAGDPHIECVRQNCTVNEDCYEFETCESNTCVSACESVTCGENAWCNVQKHVPECQCNWGMFGDPLVNCTAKKCTTNSDCHKTEYCDNEYCTPLCEDALCGTNAFCTGKNGTASCVCMDKYIGDAQTECVKQDCSAHTDCYDFEKCEDKKCVQLCGPSSCGKNAWCNVVDHAEHCKCKPGLIGNPLVECVEKSCTNNDECSDFQRCENKKCVDACEDMFCPFTTTCKVQNNATTCACTEKYEGDVHNGCVRQKCSANSDCFDYESCVDTKCTPICETLVCGENALCNVKNQVGVCSCFNGLTGDPYIKCEGEFGGYHPVAIPAVGKPLLQTRP